MNCMTPSCWSKKRPAPSWPAPVVVLEGDSQVLGLGGGQGLGVLLVRRHHAGQAAPVRHHLPALQVPRDVCARLHTHPPPRQLRLDCFRLHWLLDQWLGGKHSCMAIITFGAWTQLSDAVHSRWSWHCREHKHISTCTNASIHSTSAALKAADRIQKKEPVVQHVQWCRAARVYLLLLKPDDGLSCAVLRRCQLGFEALEQPVSVLRQVVGSPAHGTSRCKAGQSRALSIKAGGHLGTFGQSLLPRAQSSWHEDAVHTTVCTAWLLA